MSKKISIFCQFEPHTACGIHMRGKADAFVLLGHKVTLVHHPFKYDAKKTDNFEQPSSSLKSVDIYSGFFGKHPLGHKILFAPVLFFADVPRVLFLLYKSDYVFLHKPLPLALFYLLLLKICFYRGKIISIMDDWEGVGGMATIRQANSLPNKMLATLSEEWIPALANGNICSAKLTVEKMKLGEKTRDNWIWIPLGATPRREEPDFSPREKFIVGYIGTFKSRPLIDFLVSVLRETLVLSPEIQFLIVGGGEEFDYLKSGVDALPGGERVELTGQVPHSVVQEKLAEVSVCLLYLNDKFPENYMDASRSSTKMFEYMAQGKIIIASKFGEPENIIQHGKTGFLVDNSPKKFARKIHQIWESPEMPEKMGPQIHKSFNLSFSHPVLMGRVMEWAEKLP